ncbi:hypothetical protein [Alkaliphilus crotonatoxidans]
MTVKKEAKEKTIFDANIQMSRLGKTVPWTVPIFFSGLMATNSLAGGLLQLINLAIVFIIWFHFLKFIDRTNLKREQEEKTISEKEM